MIDSGIDGSHPDLMGRVVAAKSFVGGSAYRDDQGHGTFVAGEIAANPSNGIGMAGLAFNARLIIAKVVGPDGTVSLPAEVAAIRWAVAQGARVINLSASAASVTRSTPQLDTYSPLEQAAVEYAYSNGVVVVAAVGNGPQSPATPWGFAHYPAALPHVIGVSAVRRDGSVPDYSNRDAVYNDLAAPGDDIFSTIPAEPRRASCGLCRPPLLRLRFVRVSRMRSARRSPRRRCRPRRRCCSARTLRSPPDQVSWLLERSADDASPLTGCTECPVGRDQFTGWGRLDVLAALTLLGDGTALPAPDRYEPNDDAGPSAHALPPLPRTIDASLDYWDDNIDVYRIHLERRLSASTRG